MKHQSPAAPCGPPPRHIKEATVVHQSNNYATLGVEVPELFLESSRWWFGSRAKWFCVVLSGSGARSRPDMGKLQNCKLLFTSVTLQLHLVPSLDVSGIRFKGSRWWFCDFFLICFKWFCCWF